jgi:hypothetical protein
MTTFEQRFPYECQTHHHYSEVEPWLREHVGEFDREWYRYGSDIAHGIAVGVPLYDYYRLRDAQSAMLFKLRWQ